MAKKRRMKARKIKSSFIKAKKTYGRKKSKSAFGDLTPIVGSMVYGAMRNKLNELAKPITDKMPMGLGNVADNVVLGGVSYLVSKGKIPLINKIPYIKDIAKAGLIIESAMAGQDLAGNFMNTGTSTTVKTGTSNYPA